MSNLGKRWHSLYLEGGWEAIKEAKSCAMNTPDACWFKPPRPPSLDVVRYLPDTYKKCQGIPA